jgi:hypothetical protein
MSLGQSIANRAADASGVIVTKDRATVDAKRGQATCWECRGVRRPARAGDWLINTV